MMPYIIYPDNEWKRYWDMFVSLMLIFTCIMTPLWIVFDPNKTKVIHYQSDPTFNFEAANQQISGIINSTTQNNLEFYDNSDYDKFKCADFRTLRRNNKPFRMQAD